jgi:hypothetical protein
MALCEDCIEEADATVEALSKYPRSGSMKCSRCGQTLQ